MSNFLSTVGKIVNRALQLDQPVCLCCRKPVKREPHWLQTLINRVTGNVRSKTDHCECWTALKPYDFRIDWFGK